MLYRGLAWRITDAAMASSSEVLDGFFLIIHRSSGVEIKPLVSEIASI